LKAKNPPKELHFEGIESLDEKDEIDATTWMRIIMKQLVP
jgi:hypothetical protein